MIEIEIKTEKRGELAPARLGEKLKSIRARYDLTQGKMLLIVNPTELDEGNRARVSQYENGLRVPSLVETYNYARFAGVPLETLLNDDLDLPVAADSVALDHDQEMGVKSRTLLCRETQELRFAATDKASEAATLALPAETLDQLHDVYLDLLRRLPRGLRPGLTIDSVVDFCLRLVLDDYNYRLENGLLCEPVRAMIKSSEQTDAAILA